MTPRPASRPLAALLAVVAVLAAACGGGDVVGDADGAGGPTTPATDTPTPSGDAGTTSEAGAQRFPDVVQAELEPSGDAWRLSATISSPYDSPDRYADAFRAVAPDGTELGVRELLHDHASEQPFTRTLEDLRIPADVDRIVVEGRDQQHGWGGATVEVEVPR